MARFKVIGELEEHLARIPLRAHSKANLCFQLPSGEETDFTIPRTDGASPGKGGCFLGAGGSRVRTSYREDRRVVDGT